MKSHENVAEYRANPDNVGFAEDVEKAAQLLRDGDAHFKNKPPEVRAAAGWVVGGKLI